MITVTNSVQINKPVEAVFDYVSKSENSPQWQVGLDAVTDVTSEYTVGGRHTEVRTFLGQEMKTTLETVEVESNAKWVGKVVDGPVPYKVEVLYESANGGTKMTTNIEAEPTGFFKVAQGAVQSQLEKNLEESGQQLKSLLEAA